MAQGSTSKHGELRKVFAAALAPLFLYGALLAIGAGCAMGQSLNVQSAMPAGDNDRDGIPDDQDADNDDDGLVDSRGDRPYDHDNDGMNDADDPDDDNDTIADLSDEKPLDHDNDDKGDALDTDDDNDGVTDDRDK